MLKPLLSAAFLLTALAISAQTFSATVNQLVPDDGSTITFEIPVSGLPDIIDTSFGLERVCLNLNHTYDSDMSVSLQSPDGKKILLFAGVGGGDHNFIGTCLEGNGTAIAAGTAPFTGNFQSMGVMGNINNGQNPNGTWLLVIYDTYAFADQGFLIDWSITFGDKPARPFMFTSTNLPLVKLTTIGNPIGDDPKVPVLMQILDNGPTARNYVSQSNYAYEGIIMTEWQGFTGPYYPKKNYDFETVDNQGDQIDTSFLGMPKESDWIFKAEYLDHSLLKNSVTYEMARRMGGYAPRTRPCEIVLDGEYAGLYVLTEKVKRDNKRVDIAKMSLVDTSGVELTGGYIIEMNINNVAGDWNSPYPPINDATCDAPVEFKYVYPKREDIMPQQRDYIRTYVDSFENSLLSPDFEDPATGYRAFIDVKTFIDFLIVNEFSVNYDSYGRSTYMYKEKSTDGGKLKCGPPWDYDRAMDYYNPGSTNGWVWEITHPYWPFPFWWSRMWQDESYRKQLACRWTMLRQNTLSTPAFTTLIDSLKAEVYEGQERNFKLWNDLGGSTYDDNIDSLKSYVTRRLQWIDATLAAENVMPPAFYLPTDTVLCAGTTFDAGVFIGSQYTYNWQPGPDTAVITFTQDGLYHLKATDSYGCYATQAMHVTLAPSGDAEFNSVQVNSLLWAFQPNNPNANSYLWDFGDGSTSTLPNPQHQYAGVGTYVVSLTVSNLTGCPIQTTLDTIQILSVGIEEKTAFEGRIFPNPFEDKIEVDFPQPTSSPTTIVLENELGQQLLTSNYAAGTKRCTLSTQTLPAGLYNLQIIQKDKTYTQKLLHL